MRLALTAFVVMVTLPLWVPLTLALIAIDIANATREVARAWLTRIA